VSEISADSALDLGEFSARNFGPENIFPAESNVLCNRLRLPSAIDRYRFVFFKESKRSDGSQLWLYGFQLTALRACAPFLNYEFLTVPEQNALHITFARATQIDS
jgi:hypothetical protein